MRKFLKTAELMMQLAVRPELIDYWVAFDYNAGYDFDGVRVFAESVRTRKVSWLTCGSRESEVQTNISGSLRAKPKMKVKDLLTRLARTKDNVHVTFSPKSSWFKNEPPGWVSGFEVLDEIDVFQGKEKITVKNVVLLK